ncbi:hypothetical protein BGZ65_010054, partial [Modicella reniformis]
MKSSESNDEIVKLLSIREEPPQQNEPRIGRFYFTSNETDSSEKISVFNAGL